MATVAPMTTYGSSGYSGPEFDEQATAPIDTSAPSTPPTPPAIPKTPRIPRAAHTWPYREPWWIGVFLLTTFVGFMVFCFIANFQADHYTQAGAASAEATAGAIAAGLLTLGLMITTGVIYRLGFTKLQVASCATVTAVSAIFFATLPSITDNSNALTTVLDVVVALVFDLVIALGIAALTRYLPAPTDPR
jgi:hypothetical protein